MLCLLAMVFLLSGCTQDHYHSYEKALALFAEGDYYGASEKFLKLGDYQNAETYANYSLGLTYYEQGEYVEALPYFEKTQDFMYGKERYRYCLAYDNEASENFDRAAELYLLLGDYEDANIHYQYCIGRSATLKKDFETALFAFEEAGTYSDSQSRALDIQMAVYKQANEHYEAGDYEIAINLFGLLGDYLNSREMAIHCTHYFRDQRYNEAERLASEEKWMDAYVIYSSLSGYNDAQVKANNIADFLGIDITTQE